MRSTPIANSYWVIDGQLLGGEYPFDRDGQPQLDRLIEAGIDAFVDLTQSGECEPYDIKLPPHVDYLNRPIPDHGLPRQRAHMHQIQDELEELLAAGRKVYVHCRAGIGRTGMVLGCYLAGQRGEAEAALDELNHLWLQSARSASWLTIPQTPEQAQFVRDWVAVRRARSARVRGAAPAARAADLALRAAPDASPDTSVAVPAAVRSLRERFVGAMLGLACGDALAVATQYKKSGSFTPLGDMLGGGPFDLPRGAWSDDTAMALCLAESLIAQQGFDPQDQVQRYLRWQRDGYCSATGQCLGITAAAARALANSHWRRQPFSGSHDPRQIDGAVLARIAPVVMHNYGDVQRAMEQAVDAARVTCQSPVVLDGCRLLAAQLHGALRGEPPQSFLRPATELFGARALRGAVAQLAAGSLDEAAAAARGNDALLALAAAARALLEFDNFRAGALAVANAGGPSDVCTAVYGMLAGAHFGPNAIPAPWRQALARREELEAAADALLTNALLRLDGAAPEQRSAP